MVIRAGLAGGVVALVLLLTPAVALSQGRSGGPAPSQPGRWVDNGNETIFPCTWGSRSTFTCAPCEPRGRRPLRDADDPFIVRKAR